MKRYLLECVGEQSGEPVYVMRENLLGDYIRHDDADLAALVAAAEHGLLCLTRCVGPDEKGDAVAALTAALSAVAGTTTRGRE